MITKEVIEMIVNNVGYNHIHDSDFIIERPNGFGGDWLLLLLKTNAIFSLGGEDIVIPKNSIFIYPKDMPQYYRCGESGVFVNDWIHFLFENDEEEEFLKRRIPYSEPITLESIEYYSYLIKMISIENSEKNQYSADTINHYFGIMWNKLGEHLHGKSSFENTSQYEMMLTIRNKIYSFPDVPRSIDWVTHETSMSRSSFQHLYKKYFGVTFIQDLLNSRISFSKMLLITTDLPILDISEKCGFKNYEHFARIFKRECGQSALIYRNENRKKK